MNIQLSNAEEFLHGKSTGSLGQVLIRYANCLCLRFLLYSYGSAWTWTICFARSLEIKADFI